MTVVVVGCGNELVPGDELGLRVVRRLIGRRLTLPPGITLKVVEAGTPGLDLLYLLEGSDKAVIVDAVLGGGPPGRVYRLAPEDLLPAGPGIWSLHDLGVAEALELGRRVNPLAMPREVVVLGIETSGEIISSAGSVEGRDWEERAVAEALRLLEEELTGPVVVTPPFGRDSRDKEMRL